VSPPVTDLLREKRRELGIQPLSGVILERPALLRRGLLIGGGVAAAVALLSLLVLFQRQLLRARMAPLERYEAEASDLRARLAARGKALEEMETTNRNLAEALTSLHTTSALLADLQLRTPDGVQLRAAKAQGSSLVLQGWARDPQSFRRINALQLELQDSPLLKPDAMNLAKAERIDPPNRPGGADGPALPRPVSFEMSGPFATLPPARQLEVFEGLGARGMARRLQLLEREGLLP